MKKGLVLCLAFVWGLTAPAFAETWKPVVGEDGGFYDSDFLKVDESSGLVIARSATGGAAGKPYAAWPKSKSPIMLFALDCPADRFSFLGLDYTGTKGLPKDWRTAAKESDISLGVGKLGKLACAEKDSLPKVKLP